MVNCDPQGLGQRSFFPRCFNLKSGEGCDDFLHDYYFTEAENTLKKFCKAFQKAEGKVLENESKFPSKERLYIMCNMTRKRLEDPDDMLEKKNKGIRGKFRLSAGEWYFLKQEGEQGQAMTSFVKKQTWFQKVKRKFPAFKK
jgi:hypothetical protein